MGLFSSKPSKDKSQDIKNATLNNQEIPKTPRELIAEKYQKMNERSQFILEEIERVKQFKAEIDARYFKNKD